jgi:radical SAM protein with 4Fe4S-binding SPASM domain
VYLGDSLGKFILRHYKTLLPFVTLKKALNIIHSMFDFKLRKIKLKSSPFIFRIDPCTLCNLKCPSCMTPTTFTTEKRLMDYKDFLVILNKLKSPAIRFTLYDEGEPLLNKNIYKMIKATTEQKISTLISTNFNYFNENNLNDLFNSELTVLEPCLDGFTQKSYSIYRVNGNVDVLKKNIEDVIKYKKTHKKKYPYVDVQTILFDHIKNEIPTISQYLKKVGVDKITYRTESLGFGKSEPIQKETKETPCYWLYIGMMIRPNGKVYPCSGMGLNRFSFGNILEQDLEDIWNNKYYTFARALFSKGKELECDSDLNQIPCINCKKFKMQRQIKFI